MCNSCLPPLQAYGAGNYKRVGVILQRSILVCSLSLFPIAVLFLNAESILLILHQSPCVARWVQKRIMRIRVQIDIWCLSPCNIELCNLYTAKQEPLVNEHFVTN